MKKRNGFVSNSSTTSYTCDLCGHTESGYDSSGIDDFGFWRCENDHTICFDCVSDDQIEPDDDDGFYVVSSKFCPVCQFEYASNYDMQRYLKKVTGITEEEVFAEIKKINKRRKKLYANEYVLYASQKANISIVEVLKKLKEKHTTYADFLDWLRQ